MTYSSLPTIRKKVKKLAKIVNAPLELTKVSGSPDWMGGMYVEVDSSGYHYINYERGMEYERCTTKDFQELLYWILKDITYDIASNYELLNREPNVDLRRLLFRKWIELIGTIDAEFQKRLDEDITKILKDAPYVDV